MAMPILDSSSLPRKEMESGSSRRGSDGSEGVVRGTLGEEGDEEVDSKVGGAAGVV
jgi:hypothetical protein